MDEDSNHPDGPGESGHLSCLSTVEADLAPAVDNASETIDPRILLLDTSSILRLYGPDPICKNQILSTD